MGGMDDLLTALKAAAEPTRLRLLALCAHAELTVTDLTQILGQSQPRVSRHLKMLCDAGLLDRFREGAWVYYRQAETGAGADLARTLVSMMRPQDPSSLLDLERLDALKRARNEAAADYFRRNAQNWDRIRALHVPEPEVESRLRGLLPKNGVDRLLDIGTGTGRMLEIFADRARSALGVDQSREMLAAARSKLEQAGLRHCHVRFADMYQLPVPSASFDAVVIHQVLHFAEEPAQVIREAGRVLAPGGQVLIVDFARHALESLRAEHAHRRLGFEPDEITAWCDATGLTSEPMLTLPGDPLTVCIWLARRPHKDTGANLPTDQRIAPTAVPPSARNDFTPSPDSGVRP